MPCSLSASKEILQGHLIDCCQHSTVINDDRDLFQPICTHNKLKEVDFIDVAWHEKGVDNAIIIVGYVRPIETGCFSVTNYLKH